MIINIKEQYISFALEEKSFANISIQESSLKIELIETIQSFRNLKYASTLLTKILVYLKENFPKMTIYLNPLPLDRFGLNLEQLIGFYKKFGFYESSKRNIHSPFLMEKLLTE